MTIQASDVGQMAAGAVTEILERATNGTTVTEYADSTPLPWSVIQEGGWDLVGVAESADGGGGSLRDLVEVALAWGQGGMPLPFLESTWAKRWSATARDQEGPVSVSVPKPHTPVHAIPPQPNGHGPAGGVAPFGAFPGLRLARTIGRGDDVLELVATPEPEPFAPALCASLVPWTTVMPAEAALELGVLWAAEAAGAAQRLLDLSVDYAKTREQFGKPIGSFQAVKHRLADMHAEVQYAESAVVWASLEPANAHRAAAYALDTAIRVAESSIQVHGGMGFTWELGLHFYLRNMLVRRQLVHGLWS